MPILPQSRPRRPAACHCHSELALDLDDFQADVELGTLDRLATLLRQAAVPPTEPPSGLLVRRPLGTWGEALGSPNRACSPPCRLPQTEPPPTTEQQTSVRLSAPRAVLRLCFPVADLRPDRDPWAGRGVRAEQLRLELSEPQFRSELSSGPGPPAPTRLELSCSDLHGEGLWEQCGGTRGPARPPPLCPLCLSRPRAISGAGEAEGAAEPPYCARAPLGIRKESGRGVGEVAKRGGCLPC